MKTKLTLRLEENLIRRAKAYSRRHKKPVSEIVGDVFALLAPGQDDDAGGVTPAVRSLRGALAGRKRVREEDYYRHLERKHR